MTEAEINASYGVTNPRVRGLDNVVVDLQNGQIVISADFTPRPQRFQQGADAIAVPAPAPISVIITLVPIVADGRVTWDASVTNSDGSPFDISLLPGAERGFTGLLREAIDRAPRGRLTNVVITDDSITLEGTSRQMGMADRPEGGRQGRRGS